jgi:hypothetical protein
MQIRGKNGTSNPQAFIAHANVESKSYANKNAALLVSSAKRGNLIVLRDTLASKIRKGIKRVQ